MSYISKHHQKIAGSLAIILTILMLMWVGGTPLLIRVITGLASIAYVALIIILVVIATDDGGTL